MVKNVVWHGDCLELMKDIPDKSIDMILTDLPYGTTSCKWDSIIPFAPLWEQYERIIKDDGAIVLTASQPFTSALVMSNPKMYKYSWYWEKDKGTGAGISKKQPLRKIEEICVFYKKQPRYDWVGEKLKKPYKHTLPIKKSESYNISSKNVTESDERIYVEYTHKTKQNLIYFARDNGNKGMHPTQKPVNLFKYLIKTYTNGNIGAVILDNCAGSGTTAIACLELAAEGEPRNYILIEKEKEYFDIINKRIEEHKREVVLNGISE